MITLKILNKMNVYFRVVLDTASYLMELSVRRTWFSTIDIKYFGLFRKMQIILLETFTDGDFVNEENILTTRFWREFEGNNTAIIR